VPSDALLLEDLTVAYGTTVAVDHVRPGGILKRDRLLWRQLGVDDDRIRAGLLDQVGEFLDLARPEFRSRIGRTPLCHLPDYAPAGGFGQSANPLGAWRLVSPSLCDDCRL
jgi:hypothetical protein